MKPWREHDSKSAQSIVMRFKRHALIPIPAGAIIRNGFCTLKRLCDFFCKEYGACGAQQTEKQDNKALEPIEMVRVCLGLIKEQKTQSSKDAIAVLGHFCFSSDSDHSSSFSLDELTQWLHGKDPAVVKQQSVHHAAHQPAKDGRKQSRLRSRFTGRSQSSFPLLTELLCKQHQSLVEERAHWALMELSDLSLIVKHAVNVHSYSVHNEVREYIKKNPELLK